MRILYDGQIYKQQVAGGINRYFANLISRQPKEFFPTLTTCRTRNFNYPSHPNLKTFYYQRFRPGRISNWLEKRYFEAIATYKHFDLIHPTYYSLLSRQSLECYRFPAVVTVHDMIHEIFYPDAVDVEEKRKAVLAAQAIICVSENTKKDLLERYQLPEDKIFVTYLASEIDASLSYGCEPVPDLPYYLYVGSREMSYKNFQGLLKAFALVASVVSDVMLYVVGSEFNQKEQQLIAQLKLKHRICHYGYASDRHLAKLYRCSVALVYPSLYEGFGIPPLEAMSCGSVVVASNTASIPEVVGDAGLLFDPTTNDLAEILLFLLDNPAQRDRLIAKGYERAKTFSWDKTVEQTLEVYRCVSNSQKK